MVLLLLVWSSFVVVGVGWFCCCWCGVVLLLLVWGGFVVVGVVVSMTPHKPFMNL